MDQYPLQGAGMIFFRILMAPPPFVCSFLTHRGYLRSGNEDSILVAGTVVAGGNMEYPDLKEITCLPALFCVADGVGGAAYGEVASRTVLEFFSRFEIPISSEGVTTMISGAKDLLDRMVSRDPSFSGFGTTVAGLILFPDQVIIFNCGDSRVYRVYQGKIDRLSHDHSLVQELCDQGTITPDQVYTHPYRNIITSVISGDLHRPASQIMVTTLPLFGTERFLLCTDGLWEVIRDQKIADICSDGDLTQVAGALLAACLDGGGPDNISLILIGSEHSSR